MAFKKSSGASKPLTKSQIIGALAEETGIAKKDVGALLGALAELAYAQAACGFTIPGVGKLVIVQRKARMGRNPATGEQIKIAAKKVLKFRIAKQAKDAILPKTPAPK
jgi:DNA-binding protein HU-beta